MIAAASTSQKRIQRPDYRPSHYSAVLYLCAVVITVLACLSVPAFGQCKLGANSFASHTLLLHPAGIVRSWGYNNSGQLGNGTEVDISTPATVLKGEYPGTKFLGDDPENPVTAVAALYRHSLALTASGIVYGWGADNFGELGFEVLGNRDTAVRIPRGEYPGTQYLGDDPSNKIISINGGINFSAVLAADGIVYTFGRNDYGQLGNNDTARALHPIRVLKGEYNGTAWLGDNPNNPVIAIACGAEGHILALTADGSVFAWGRNNLGQLGTGDTASVGHPIRVRKGAYNGTEFLGDNPDNPVIALAAGGGGILPNVVNCSGALLADGTVMTWGGNAWSLLGDGTSSDRHLPVFVVKGAYKGTAYLGDDPSNPVRKLSMGGYEVAALLADGSVYTWGNNLHGQLGNNSRATSPAPVRVVKGQYNGTSWLGDNLSAPVVDITAAERDVIVVVNGYRVYGWGDNHRLQLLQSGFDNQTPVLIADFSSAATSSVSFGKLSSCNTRDSSVLLENTGVDAVIITQISKDDPDASFSMVLPTLPDTINPGESLRVPVQFAPTVNGSIHATVNFHLTDLSGTLQLGTYTSNLYGEGVIVQGAANIAREYIAPPGTSLTIPVIISEGLDSADVSEFTFRISFNGKLVRLTDDILEDPSLMLQGTLLEGWSINILEIKDSSLTLRLKAPAGMSLKSIGTLLKLHFELFDKGVRETELPFTIEIPDQPCVAVATSPGHISLLIESGVNMSSSQTSFQLSAVAPDPAYSSCSITLSLAGPTPVSMFIYDITGRLVGSPLHNSLLPAGQHIEQIHVDALPNGVYTLECRIGQQREIQRFVVAR